MIIFKAGATYFYSLFWDKIALTRLTRNTNNAANIAICRGLSGQGFSLGCYLPENVDKSYYQGVELYAGSKPFYGLTIVSISQTQIRAGQLRAINHRFSAKIGYT